MPDLVYIADDEPNIRKLAALALKDSGFETQEFADGVSLMAAVRVRKPDAIVLDWMMPPPDGLAVCHKIRADESTRPIPILMLTARGEEVDRVLGLEMGADDYITKPFEPTELVARVEAVLRRCGKAQGTLAAFDVVLDPAARRVTRSGTPLHLTPREFDLLEVLLRNRGIVLYREVLYERVWGLDAEYDSRTLDLHIQRLRKKLGWKNEIRTVFRVGYVLERGE